MAGTYKTYTLPHGNSTTGALRRVPEIEQRAPASLIQLAMDILTQELYGEYQGCEQQATTRLIQLPM